MNSRYIDGAWYTDVLPGGHNVSLFKENCVMIDDRRVEIIAGDQPLFIRACSYQGKVFMAGKGNGSGNCLLSIDGDKWKSFGPTFGNSPVAFYAGLMFVVRSMTSVEVYDLDNLGLPPTVRDGQIGTQGIRFIEDNIIYSGDMTYDGSGDNWRMAEWTLLSGSPDIYVGQSYDGYGAIVYFGDTTKTRILELGDCKFIRAYRDGSYLAFAIVKQEENRAKVITCSVDELRSLPIVVIPAEKKMDHSDVVRRIAEQFKDRSSEQAIGQIPLHVAWELRGEGVGLLWRKNGGEGVFSVGDKLFSIKRVCYPDQRLIKILSDSGVNGTNGPQWADEGQSNPNDVYHPAIDPSSINAGGGNGAGNGDNPPPPTSSDIEGRLKKLEDGIRDLTNKMTDAIKNWNTDNALRDGDVVSIRSASERPRYLRYDWDKGIVVDRDEVKGPGEKFVIDKA